MTKTSLAVRMLFPTGCLALSLACSSTGPVPLGSGGTGAGGLVGPAGGAAAGGDGAVGGAPTGGAAGLTNDIPLGGSYTSGDTNTVGIQGAFYILEDSVKDGALVPEDGLVHSDFDDASAPTLDVIDASTFSATTPKPCISGTAQQAIDPAAPVGTEPPYDKIWGGGIGMNLNTPTGEGTSPMAYDATAHGVAGFEFQVSGTVAAGATVRFKATQVGMSEDFCKAITVVPGTTVKVLLSELKHMCWGDDGTLVLDTTQLEALQWQIVTGKDASYKVTDFCVEKLGWVAP
jgi:hypothetical protein